MSISFSALSIRNPIPSILLFIVLTVTGLIAFTELPINSMPSIAIPAVSVKISQLGAASTEIETQITHKVEGAIAGINGVKHISTTISEGTSLSMIEFQFGTDLDRAISDVRNAIFNIRGQLPQSIQEPLIQRIDTDGSAILIYSVEASETCPEDLSWFIDNTISRELLSIKDVAKVERTGGIDHEITLNLDPGRLAALGISAADISRQLAQNNINLPSGRVILAGKEYLLRTLGSVKNIELLKEIRMDLGNNKIVKLADLGDFIDRGAERRSITRLDGKPVIIFSVYRNKGSSEVTVAEKVEEKLIQIGLKQPNIIFKQIFSLVKLTKTNFNAAVYSFCESTFLTILVVFFFLRDRRATLIAALAIPLSIIPTFLILYWLDFTLNWVTLLGISLVTGVLVDDAIVEIENIHRHMNKGKKPYDAAILATNEIGLTVISTTLVICAVFIPVSLIHGIVGQFFKEFGLTVSIAALFSLLVARILTPMLASRLLKKSIVHQEKNNLWLEKYQKIIEWTLDNRRKTIIIATIGMILSFSIIPFLSTGFLPYQDYSESNLTIELPQGSILEQTDTVAQRIVKLLKKHKEVEYVLTKINDQVNIASIKIKLVEPNKRKIDQRQFENKVLLELKLIPDVIINFSNLKDLKDVSLVFTSDDNYDMFIKTMAAIENDMQHIVGLHSIRNSMDQKQLEIVIIPNYAKAAQLGINIQNISDAISVATIGDNENNLAKFNYGNRQVPIRVRLPKNDIKSLSVIENFKIPTIKGSSVALSTFSNINFGVGPSTIEHYDRKRKITIEANLGGITLSEALAKIYTLPSIKTLPKGIEIQNTGDIEAIQELFIGFIKSITLGLLMVYVIQVLLYKDWIQPLTRMTALPLSIGGTFFMLLITGTDLNMPALIGILMLMGISDKNSIFLVDCMIELRNHKIPRREAIIKACMIRARPIIMTTFAMLAGMMPIAIGIFGDAFRKPMAIAVIGGLISSTTLSLILVPVMFSYVDDFEKFLLPKLKKLLDLNK
jgi:multidrug efflux pump subunit AcrB